VSKSKPFAVSQLQLINAFATSTATKPKLLESTAKASVPTLVAKVLF